MKKIETPVRPNPPPKPNLSQKVKRVIQGKNEIRPKLKTTKMEDDQNGRRPKWKTTKMEDAQGTGKQDYK